MYSSPSCTDKKSGVKFPVSSASNWRKSSSYNCLDSGSVGEEKSSIAAPAAAHPTAHQICTERAKCCSLGCIMGVTFPSNKLILTPETQYKKNFCVCVDLNQSVQC